MNHPACHPPGLGVIVPNFTGPCPSCRLAAHFESFDFCAGGHEFIGPTRPVQPVGVTPGIDHPDAAQRPACNELAHLPNGLVVCASQNRVCTFTRMRDKLRSNCPPTAALVIWSCPSSTIPLWAKHLRRTMYGGGWPTLKFVMRPSLHHPAASGILEGRIFRRVRKEGYLGEALSPAAVRDIVQARCALAGVEGEYSAHSLRSGFATEASWQDVTLADTMAMTGHRSVAAALKY